MHRTRRIANTERTLRKPNNKNVQKKEKRPVEAPPLLIFDDEDDVIQQPIKSPQPNKKSPKTKTIQKIRQEKKPDKRVPVPSINTAELYQQSIDIIYECDPDQNCSKEDLIERLEYKRDQLQEELESQEKEKNLAAIDHVLSQLKETYRAERFADIESVRGQQDLIVKKNKLKPEHFKSKIDLTPGDGEDLGEDEQTSIVFKSRAFFKKNSHYEQLPVGFKNPFSKGMTRGNRKPPADLLNNIESKFT